MDCEFIGGRIVKDLTRGGRGWKWIWDPMPGTDLGVDADETLFMVYGSTTPDGGAYATFADVLAAIQAALDLSALGGAVAAYVQHTDLAFDTNDGNSADKEANTDHDYRYAKLGAECADAYFDQIGRGTGTKTTATPSLAIDLIDSALFDDAGDLAVDWDSRFLHDADELKTLDWDACLLWQPGAGAASIDWSTPAGGATVNGDLYVKGAVQVNSDDSGGETYTHKIGGTVYYGRSGTITIVDNAGASHAIGVSGGIVHSHKIDGGAEQLT
jgi:hypothetical protein